jgi:hypothetical protein
MEERKGITEVSQIIHFAFLVTMKILERARDGIQILPDAIAIIIDENVRAGWADAANNAREALPELQDLDLEELAGLFQLTIGEVRDLLAFIRGGKTLDDFIASKWM